MQCKQCGIENKDSAKFCKACGASLRETPVQTSNFCPACGTENSVKAVYCKSCGEKLQSIEPISDAVLETSSNADELQQSEQITEPNISEQELQQPEQEYTEPSPQQSVPVYKDVHNAETIEIDQAQFDQQQFGQPQFGSTDHAGQINAGAEAHAAYKNGAPAQDVRPVAAAGASKESIGPKLAELFRMTFKSPVRYLEKVSKRDDYWLPVLFVVLVTALIISAIPAISISRAYSGYSGYYSGPSGISIFFGIFIFIVAIEALCVVAMFISEKIFGSHCSFKEVAAANGPSLLLINLALVVMLLFAMTESAGMMIIAYIFACPMLIMSQIIIVKGHEAVSGLKDARLVYSYVTFTVISVIFAGIVTAIAGASIFDSVSNSFGMDLNNLLNNL